MLIYDRIYQKQAEVGICETTTSQSEYHKIFFKSLKLHLCENLTFGIPLALRK